MHGIGGGSNAMDSNHLKLMSVDADDAEVAKEKDARSPMSWQPICSSSAAARVARKLISFLIVIGTSATDEETFLLTCKVLARLIGASQNGLHLGHITDETQLTTLLRLGAANGHHATSNNQRWLNHAIYCLLVDYLRIAAPKVDAAKGLGNSSVFLKNRFERSTPSSTSSSDM